MDSRTINREVSEEKSCKNPRPKGIRVLSGGESVKETNVATRTTMTIVPIIATDSVERPDGKATGKSRAAAIVVEGRDGRRGGGEGGGGESKSRWISDSKIAETSIAVIVQSTAIVIPLHFSAGLSSATRDLLVCVLVANLVGLLFCMAAIIQSHKRPRAAGIFARMGCAATVVGFILMIALTLPDNHVWKIAPACLVLFVAFVLSIFF